MVFLITGPDTYRARQKLMELKNKFLKEVDPSGLNIRSVKSAALAPRAISHFLESQPLLARRRMVIFENILAEKKLVSEQDIIEALGREEDRVPGQSNIFIFFEDSESRAKSKLHSWLTKRAHLFRFPELTGGSLAAWVEAEFQRCQRTASAGAIRRLISVTGSDLWRLSGEIQKLDAFLEPDSSVDEQVVKLLIDEPFDSNIFLFIDAVLEGNIKQSSYLLMEHLGRETSPQQLVVLLEKPLRALILLTVDKKATPAENFSGIHPYMIKKLRPLAKRYDLHRLKDIYASLLAVDTAMKSSSGDAQTLLLNFLLKSSYSRGS